jgi:hypothetical protein
MILLFVERTLAQALFWRLEAVVVDRKPRVLVSYGLILSARKGLDSFKDLNVLANTLRQHRFSRKTERGQQQREHCPLAVSGF